MSEFAGFAVLSKWEVSALPEESMDKVLGVSQIYLVQVGFLSETAGNEDDTPDALKGYTGTVVKDRSEVSKVLLEYEITRCPCVIRTGKEKISYEELQTGVSIGKQEELSKNKDEVKDLVDRGVEAFDGMDLQLAVSMFTEAWRWDSQNTSALFNLASICHMSNYPTLAVHYFQAVLEIDRTDMTALKSLWNLAQSHEGEDSHLRNCCIRAYQALVDKFDDPTAKQKLAALTGSGEGARIMDTTYARAIYEDLGENFESRLVDVLEYRGPWILHDLITSLSPSSSLAGRDYGTASLVQTVPQVHVQPLLAQYLPPLGAWRVLDLGCGSGLVGRAFGDFVGLNTDPPPVKGETTEDDDEMEVEVGKRTSTLLCDVLGDTGPLQEAASFKPLLPLMAGADISSKMTQITARTGRYHAVACCDAQSAVQVFSSAEGKAKLHLVVAADTFIYIGALGGMFGCVREALLPGGLFTFSVEDLDRSSMKTSYQARSSTNSIGDADDNSGGTVDGGNLSGTRVETQTLTMGRGREVVDDSGKCHLLLDDEVVGAVPGWGAQLLTSTRFAHSTTYIEVLVATHGFHVCACSSVVLRKEASVPVYGVMWILQKEV